MGCNLARPSATETGQGSFPGLAPPLRQSAGQSRYQDIKEDMESGQLLHAARKGSVQYLVRGYVPRMHDAARSCAVLAIRAHNAS